MEELNKTEISWNHFLFWYGFEIEVILGDRDNYSPRRSRTPRTPKSIGGGDSNAQQEVEVVTKKSRKSKRKVES